MEIVRHESQTGLEELPSQTVPLPKDAVPEVSVVIVSFNTGMLLRRCIDALVCETNLTPYEIIVVDNASADNSTEIVHKEYPFVRLICNSANLGFAAGQNTGLRASRGRFLLVMNSDVVIAQGAIDNLVKFLREADPDVAGAGPLVRNNDGSVAPSARRSAHSLLVVIAGIIDEHLNVKRLLPRFLTEHSWGRALLGRFHDNFVAHNTIREAEVLDGMCVLFKRHVLEKVGLFDEQFFFDYEIIDLCNRIRHAGFRLLFHPGATVTHIGHESRKKAPAIVVETHRSHLIFTAKYHPRRVSLVRGCIEVVALLAALLCKVRMAWSSIRQEELGDLQDRYRLYTRIVSMARAFDRKKVHLPGLIGWAGSAGVR